MFRTNMTNAMTLYITACRYVIQADQNIPESWEDLYRYLPYLRQALSCCVCGKLLLCPMGPVESACLHHVCQNCIGKKMRMKPSCSWCKDFDSFVENRQLRSIVKCFTKLCEYIASSQIGRRIATGDVGNGLTNNLLTILQEASEFHDDFDTGFTLLPVSLLPAVPVAINRNNVINKHGSTLSVEVNDRAIECFGLGQVQGHGNAESSRSSVPNCNDTSYSDLLQQKSVHAEKTSDISYDLCNGSSQIDNNYLPRHRSQNGTLSSANPTENSEKSIDHTDDSFRLSLAQSIAAEHDYNTFPSQRDDHGITGDDRRRQLESGSPVGRRVSIRLGSTEGDEEARNMTMSDSSEQSPPRKVTKTGRASKKHKPKGCQCGNATPNPGKLTCCGQRCPCYSAHKGCTDCRCRGCRNPRKEIKVEIVSDETHDSDIEIEVDN